MLTRFQSLFEVKIDHGYYQGGDHRDFDFLWAADSRRMMGNGRLVSRVRNGNLHCLYEADRDGKALVPIAGEALTLGLRLRNPDFTTFTQIEFRPGTCRFHRNRQSPTEFDPPVEEELLHPDLRREGVFACCEIRIAEGFYPAPPTFLIGFLPRSEVVRYYVVARNYSDSEFAQLAVTDKGFLEDGRPQVAFERVEPPFGDGDIDPGILGAPQKRVVLFRSQAPISRQPSARKKIQLIRNGEVLVANLPAPGAESARGDFIIHLAKP